MEWIDLETARRLIGDMAVEHSVVIADPSRTDCPMLFVSGEFCRQTGYDFNEVLGRNCRFLQGPETDPLDIARIRQALAKTEPLTIDILNYRKDGSKFWNRLRIRPLFDNKGELLYYAGDQNPVAEHNVRRHAITDIID